MSLTVTFDAPEISSDGGWLLLADLDRQIGLTERLAACLHDDRDPARVQHVLLDQRRQRVYQIAAGYEDTNDADTLRRDPLLKTVLGRLPSSDDLASQPTLCRFENGRSRAELFALGEALFDHFVADREGCPPRSVVIDLDGTPDEAHGAQQLTFFNGHVGNHCFLPLLVFVTCDQEDKQAPVGVILRPGNSGAAAGTLPVLKRLVGGLSARWPGVRIRVRLDGGFASPLIYDWLEARQIDYTIGLPINPVLKRLAEPFLAQAREAQVKQGETVRLFAQVKYRAGSWKRARRVIVKAEVTPQGQNPRFLVISARRGTPEKHYGFYTQRGDVENRIKELKLHLRSDRTSCHRFDANQFRLLLHLAAYLLLLKLRDRWAGTPWATAQVQRLILSLVKVGAWVQETTRGVRVRLSASYPYSATWKRLVPN